VDALNVYQAALTAMQRAVEALPEAPEHLLVDARTIPGCPQPQNPFNKGDGINFSIAAASIVAKTHRDALMDALDARYPGYGFARHKGYGTAEHQEAIRTLGPCPAHRRSFDFLRELQGEYCDAFYALRARLDAAATVAELRLVEAAVRESDGLAEHELRKLKTLLTRRWKTV
jgi:ribonuclease HII